MSDTTPPPAATDDAGDPTEQPQTDAPAPTETVEFWKAKAREQEKRAKDNAAAAKRLAELEDAQKTEAERAAERIASLEAETTAARAEALRFKVASKHGISDEDADLFLTGTDEETLTKQAQRLAARDEDAGKPRPPKPDRTQGRQQAGSASTADQFAATVGGLLSS